MLRNNGMFVLCLILTILAGCSGASEQVEPTADIFTDVRNRIENIEGVQAVENIRVDYINPGTDATISIVVNDGADTALTAVTIYSIVFEYAVNNFEVPGEYEYELYMTVNDEQSRWSPAGGSDWSVQIGQNIEVVSVEDDESEIEGTATLIQSSSVRIDDLFLSVEGVTSVELASERERDTQINGLAMVTTIAEADLIETRNSIWDVWAEHASGIYPDKPLVLDLTIMQGSTETIWQFTSNSADWLQLK